MNRLPNATPLLAALVTAAALFWPSAARAGAEVKLDREFIAGLVEKVPPAPFKKDGQYRGSARGFRLAAIDPAGRRLVVACEVAGEYRPPVAQAVRKGDPDGGWKSFAFDVRASVKAEPGPDGAPRFWVDVDEVKRRELEGLPGALAKVLGRHFDDIVTQVADGKAALLSARVNDRLRQKIAAFKEYGVLREIAYAPDELVLTFDVTKFRSDGIAGYVFASPRDGTVPLHRWHRPGLGDRFYSISPAGPVGHPYYVYEGVSCHVYDSPRPGTVALNRWRGPREWFYTSSPDGEGIGRWGYRRETVACYVLSSPAPDAVPLYRFTDPRTGVHFYTTHPHAEFAK
jgi:hypothetical protein